MIRLLWSVILLQVFPHDWVLCAFLKTVNIRVLSKKVAHSCPIGSTNQSVEIKPLLIKVSLY